MNNLIKNMIVTTVLSILLMLNLTFVIVPLFDYDLSVSFISYVILIIMCLFLFFNFKEVAERIHLNYKLIKTIKILTICFFIFNIIVGLENYFLIIEVTVMLITIVLSNMISNKMIEQNFDGKSTLSMINYFLIILCFINIIPEMYKKSYTLTVVFLVALCINRFASAVLKYITEEKDYDFEDELEKLDEKEQEEKKYKYINTIGLIFQLLFFILIWELVLNVWEIPGIGIVNLYFLYFSMIFIILAMKILNINTSLMNVYQAEKIKLVKKFTVIVLQTIVLILLYLGVQKFIYEGINNSIIMLTLLIAEILVLETLFKFNYAKTFGFRWLILIGASILIFSQATRFLPMFSGNTINVVLIDCLLLTVAIILGVLYYVRNYKVEKTKENFDRIEQLVYTAIIMVTIATLMNLLTFNVSLTIYNAMNTLSGEDTFVFEMPTIFGLIIPSVIAAIALVSININKPTLRKILVILKYIAAMYIFYRLSEGVKLISTFDMNTLPNIAVLYAAYLTAKGVSVKGKRFVALISNVVLYLIIVEILFYMSELLMIPIDGMSLKTYRIVLTSLIGTLLFSYIYLRNIKINKEDRIFTSYRLLSSSLVVILLFFGVVSGTTSSLTDSLRDKLIEMLLNSNFDIDESLFDTPIYMNALKDQDGNVLFIKDTTADEYEVGNGWNYGTGSEIINTEDTSSFMNDEYENYDNYFSNKSLNDWYVRENVKINYPTERLLLENKLSLPTLYQDLNIENGISASLYDDSRVVVDDYRVGEIAFDSYTIDYNNELIIEGLKEDFVNPYNYKGTYTYIPDEIYDEVISMKKEIDFMFGVDEDTNDFDILVYVALYISTLNEIVIEEMWENSENIEECISTNVCNMGEVTSLFSFVSRSYGIPIRNTAGLALLNSDNEVKFLDPLGEYLPKIPSLEIESPSIGWIDGTFLTTLLLGDMPDYEDLLPEEEEEPDEVLEDDVLFNFTNNSNSDLNLFIRDSIVDNYNDDKTTYRSAYCETDGTHIEDILFLEQGLGLDINESKNRIENNVTDNKVFYAPINTQQITNSSGVNINTCLYENTGTMHKDSEYIAKGEVYVTTNKSIDWDSEDNYEIIKNQFDQPFTSDNGISEIFVPNLDIITELSKLNLIDSNIINSYSNNYEKLMYINAVVNSEFNIYIPEGEESEDGSTVDNSLGIIEAISNKIVSENQLVVIKSSLASMNDVHTRLTSGFYTNGEASIDFTEEYRGFNLEILMPTILGNQWISLPDRISKLDYDNRLNLDTKNIDNSQFLRDTINITEDIIDVSETILKKDVDINENHYVIKGDTSMYTKVDNEITFVGKGTIEIEFFVFSTITGHYATHIHVFEVENSDIVVKLKDYGIIYETESWNVCNEFVSFHEPDRPETAIVPIISLADSPNGADPYLNCDYQFAIAGEYTFDFNVNSAIPNVPPIIEKIVIIVEEVEIDFRINEGYNEFANLAELRDLSLAVLDGFETDVCTIMEYFDPIKAIANNGGRMPSNKIYDIVSNTNITSNTSNGCLNRFSSPGVASSIMYEASVDLLGGAVTRSETHELEIIVETDEVNVDIANIPTNFFETKSIDFSIYISSVYYNTGHELNSNSVVITLDSGINNGDPFAIVTIGETYDVEITFSKEASVFGTMQPQIFDTTIEKAFPEDLNFTGEENVEIINGKDLTNIASSYNAKSVLGTSLEYNFIIINSSTVCTAQSPCDKNNIEDSINNYFSTGSISMGRTENLTIIVEVLQSLQGSTEKRVAGFLEQMSINVHSEIPEITSEPITDIIWDQDKNNYNFLNLLRLNSNQWEISDYLSGSIECYVMLFEVDCTNFNSKNYSSIDSINGEDKLLLFRYSDLKGTTHEIDVNFTLKQSSPSIDYNASLTSNDFYMNYYYNFCDYVLGYGKDYEGEAITEIAKYEIYVDSQEVGCSRVKLTKSTIALPIEFVLTDRGYTSRVTVNIVVKEQNDKPEIVLPTSLVHEESVIEEQVVLTTNSITKTNEERIFDFKSDIENNICDYITAIDQGNGQTLYATTIEIMKKDGTIHEVVNCKDISGDVINYSFNDIGEYTFIYFFEDTAGNTVSGSIKVAVLPSVFQENIFSIAATEQYGIISFQLVGYDESGNPIFADQFSNLSTDYEFTFDSEGKRLELGDIYTSLYEFEDGEFRIVDSFKYWDKDFYYEYDDERTFETKKSGNTCIFDSMSGYYFKNFDFIYKKQGGEYVIIDACGEYTLNEVKLELGEDHVLFQEIDLEEDHSYSFGGFVSVNGFVRNTDISEEQVFNLAKIVFDISLVVGVISFAFTIYYYLFKKKYEVQFLLDIPEGLKREVVIDDKDGELTVDDVEYRYFKIYYSKLIEKKYKNIIEAYRNTFGKPGISKKQTYHEYMDEILGENSVFDREEFLIITNIFTRCRYYEPTVIRKYYIYFNNYYYNFFKDLEIVFPSEKSKIRKLKRW